MRKVFRAKYFIYFFNKEFVILFLVKFTFNGKTSVSVHKLIKFHCLWHFFSHASLNDTIANIVLLCTNYILYYKLMTGPSALQKHCTLRHIQSTEFLSTKHKPKFKCKKHTPTVCSSSLSNVNQIPLAHTNT